MSTTYEPIATTTLGTAAASITLSSIPSTFTDLVIIFTGTQGAFDNTGLRFNGDTGSNYSKTMVYDANSNRGTNDTSIRIMIAGTTINSTIWQIMNYANSTTYKTALCRSGIASDQVRMGVGLWRSTSAINEVTFLAESGNFGTGTTVSIYGIKAA